MNWRERYEIEAASELAEYEQKSLDVLFNQIRSRQYGRYFSLWRAIASRAQLEQAGWLLFEVLQTESDYLQRYHCAGALLSLMGLNRTDAVNYSADSADRFKNLHDLKVALSDRIGGLDTQ
jgi:hypothetical protein